MATEMEEQKFIVKGIIPLFFNDVETVIELCVGDISKLDRRNKVEILLISGRPNSYKTPAGTVMHSLLKNLKVNVADLAKNKEVDKRDTHKCWWSKPIQLPNVPFERLMCYESGEGQAAAAEFTNTAFSCLKELFGKKQFNMVASLLNTGNQKMDEVVMLEAIVEAAIDAVKNGLTIGELMIFINADYKRAGDATPKVRNFEGICTKFEELRKKYTIG